MATDVRLLLGFAAALVGVWYQMAPGKNVYSAPTFPGACTIPRYSLDRSNPKASMPSLSRAVFESQHGGKEPFIVNIGVEYTPGAVFTTGKPLLESLSDWLRGAFDNSDEVRSSLHRIHAAERDGSAEERSQAGVISPWFNQSGTDLRATYGIPEYLGDGDMLHSLDLYLRSIQAEFGYPSVYVIFGPSGSGAQHTHMLG